MSQRLGLWISIGFLTLILSSCGGSQPPAEPLAAPEKPAVTDTAAEASASADKPSTSTLAITDIRKQQDGKYSATLNGAIVFKDLEIRPGDDGRDRLFFPKSPGRDEKEFHIVYLEDRSIAGQIKDAIKAGKASGKAEPDALKVTQVKWRALESQSKVKGFADVTFNDAITIKGCKLIEGKEGDHWLAWPSVKRGEEYVDLVFAIDKGVKSMAEAAVKKESGLK